MAKGRADSPALKLVGENFKWVENFCLLRQVRYTILSLEKKFTSGSQKNVGALFGELHIAWTDCLVAECVLLIAFGETLMYVTRVSKTFWFQPFRIFSAMKKRDCFTKKVSVSFPEVCQVFGMECVSFLLILFLVEEIGKWLISDKLLVFAFQKSFSYMRKGYHDLVFHF